MTKSVFCLIINMKFLAVFLASASIFYPSNSLAAHNQTSREALDSYLSNVDTTASYIGGRLETIKNSDKQKVLKKKKKVLEAMSKNGKSLQYAFDHLLQNPNATISTGIDAIITERKQWAEEKIKSVKKNTKSDKSKVKKAKQMIDELIQRHKDIESCGDELFNLYRKHENEVHNAIADSNLYVTAALQEVQNCIKSEDDSEAARKCKKDSKNTIRNLKPMIDKLYSLGDKSHKLHKMDVKDIECGVNALKSFDADKAKIKKELSNLGAAPDSEDESDDSDDSDDSDVGDAKAYNGSDDSDVPD